MARNKRPFRPLGLGGYLLIFLATVIVGGLTGGIAAFLTEVGVGGALVVGLCAAIGLGLIFLICIAWWNRVDEAAREAHKWAWWWGGTAGTAISGVIMIVVVLSARDETSTLLTSASAANLIYSGGMVVMTCQVVGYGIAWAAWWLQRR